MRIRQGINTTQIISLTAISGLLAAAALSCGSSPAHADEGNPSSAPHHVYLDEAFEFDLGVTSKSRSTLERDETLTSTRAIDDDEVTPDGVSLSEGETVVVHYTNAVSTISSAASCTQSTTASTPYKSGGRAHGHAVFTRSFSHRGSPGGRMTG
ncbi:hypothetical protein [Brevibacterium litoralis]|uniref:hypothetical protein n=1 Tax=Brevibacterium litoralis TaxID=3138935 RepID=UPI0032EFA134